MSPKETNSENIDRHNRIMNAIRGREWGRQLLTSLALSLGLLSIAAGIGTALWYRVLLEPKIDELQQGYAEFRQQIDQTPTNTPARMLANDMQMETYRRNREFAHMVTTHALGVETMWIGISIALVGVGTLITAVLVVVTRRITLRQINESLINISNQIKELENRGD